MIEATLFDFDGVVVDTEGLKFEALKTVFFDKFGLEIELDVEFIGQRGGIVVAHYLEKYSVSASVEELKRRQYAIYHQLVSSRRPGTISGVREFMRFVKRRNLRLALVTGSLRSWTSLLLSRHGMAKVFEVIVTNEDCAAQKPAPDPYIRAVKMLALNADECVVIEDSPAGIQAAKSAGCMCVAIATTFAPKSLSEADLVVNNYRELEENPERWLS